MARKVFAAIWLCAVIASPTWAQYPAKLVRIINPVAAGGNQDIISRAVADQLTRAFGQPVGYDPLRDFAAVTRLAEVPLVLVVTPALPVKNVGELIALAKARPGELSTAHSGPGSTGHVASEMFCRRAGVKMLHVHYKGAAPAVIDLVGGHVMLRFDQVSTSLPFIRSNKLRALGVTTLKRSAVLPAVPTIAESGVAALAGFNDPTYNGLMAPAGTPREVLERVRAEVARGVAEPVLHKRFLDIGIELLSSAGSDEFAAFLKKQASEFAVLAREAGIKSN